PAVQGHRRSAAPGAARRCGSGPFPREPAREKRRGTARRRGLPALLSGPISRCAQVCPPAHPVFFPAVEMADDRPSRYGLVLPMTVDAARPGAVAEQPACEPTKGCNPQEYDASEQRRVTDEELSI